MRRQMCSLIFAGFVALCATPLAASPAIGEDAAETAAPQATVAVQRVSLPAPGLRDEAAMVLVGTMLIGLAAVVRRAV